MVHRGYGKLAALTIALLACGEGSARADLDASLAVEVTDLGGLFRYDYTLANLPTSTVGVSSLFLDVPASGDLASFTTPTGFDVFYAPGDPNVEFTSSAPGFDIAPGASALFSFTSPIVLVPQSFLIRGIDDATGSVFEVTGVVNVVPEPSAFLLGVLGAASLACGCLARRRGRASGRFAGQVRSMSALPSLNSHPRTIAGDRR